MLDHDRIRTLASQLSALADTCSQTTVMFTSMIGEMRRTMDDIDRRLKALEAAEAARSVGINPQPGYSPGCTCPPGAEQTCKGYGCPRVPHGLGPGPKAFVF